MSALQDISLDTLGPRRWSHFSFSLRALGRLDPPARLRVGTVPYTRTRVIKHDFFAATAFYDSPVGPAVLKAGRLVPFLGLPLDWIGRGLRDREVRFYRKLQDLPEVPRLIARWGKTGFLHAYLPGQPLRRDRPVPDRFFEHLDRLFDTLHARGIAYVDTNKPENILHTQTDTPGLIDFQISFDIAAVGRVWPFTWLLRVLQRGDRYHLLKHKRRFRPDLLSETERRLLEKRSWPIRLHRVLTRPYFFLRRRGMRSLKKSGRVLPEGSK